jgi:hypothetical protein
MGQEIDVGFEWDPVKAQSNALKHDVTFDQAATVFLDAYAISYMMRHTVKLEIVGSHWVLISAVGCLQSRTPMKS